MKQIIHTDNAPHAIGAYSQAIGGIVHVEAKSVANGKTIVVAAVPIAACFLLLLFLLAVVALKIQTS